MQDRSGSTLKGVVTISLMTLNVIAWCTLLFTLALLKLLVPIPAWRRWASRGMTGLAEGWIGTNNALFRLMHAMPLDTRGLEGLSTRDWYLVVSNHRSWVDILVLQAVFNRRIPFLKFFLKTQLIWVPFLGIAWWALDFPFMRRHTSAYLAKHPEHRVQHAAHGGQHEGRPARAGRQQVAIGRLEGRALLLRETRAFDEIHHRRGDQPEFLAGVARDLEVLAALFRVPGEISG